MKQLSSSLRIFIDLTVPQYIILIIITTVSASFIINGAIDENFFYVLIGGVSLSFGVLGLNAFNQIYDLEIDKISKPKRPLPSGKISKNQVLLLSSLFFIASVLVAFLINYLFLIVCISFIIISIIYSAPPFRLKRFWLSSNIVGGTLYGALPFISMWTIFSYKPFDINFFLIFYALMIIMGSTKDFEDVKGDKKAKIITLPIRFGKKRTVKIIGTLISLVFTYPLILVGMEIIDFKYIYPTILSFMFTLIITLFILNYITKNREEFISSEGKIVSSYKLFTMVVFIIFGLVALL